MNRSIEHVAVIMDGNGRWAKKRFRPRIWGHVRGSHRVSEIVEEADALGLKSLTMYAFSNENWSRPLNEIKGLIRLLEKFLQKERKRILTNKIKFRVIGDISQLSQELQDRIISLEEQTCNASGLKLSFAFNYGSHQELLRSINTYIESHPGEMIEPKDIEKNLYLPDIAQIDLLIRTSGEQRISNFLLWQIAYSELYFTPTLWPDFSPKEFRSIIDQVSKRERRFGAVDSQDNFHQVIERAKENKGIISQDTHQ